MRPWLAIKSVLPSAGAAPLDPRDHAAAARAVLHHDGRAERSLHLLRQQPRHGVDRPAGANAR